MHEDAVHFASLLVRQGLRRRACQAVQILCVMHLAPRQPIQALSNEPQQPLTLPQRIRSDHGNSWHSVSAGARCVQLLWEHQQADLHSIVGLPGLYSQCLRGQHQGSVSAHALLQQAQQQVFRHRPQAGGPSRVVELDWRSWCRSET